MTRLILAILVATALWPVDENNAMLGFGNSNVSPADVAATGYALVSDLSGFCARNMDTCETVGEVAGEAAYRLSAVLVAAQEEEMPLSPRLANTEFGQLK